MAGALLPAGNPCRAPTVRQQGTRHPGLRCAVDFRLWTEEPGSGCDPGSPLPL